MKIAIALLLVSLVVGQIVRFPLPGQGGGLLLSDIATVAVLVVALIHMVKHRLQNTKPKQNTVHNFQNTNCLGTGNLCFGNCLCSVLCLLCFFFVWSLFTLVVHISDLGRDNFLIAAAYWLRLAATLLLLPALLALFQKPTLRLFSQRAFTATIAMLAVLGFIQLTLFPNLWDLSRVAPALAGAKWDPHQGRLVATWLDPNFIGGFFAITLPFVMIKVFLPLTKGVGVLTVLAAAFALLLTQSRSSLVALVLGAAITAPLWLVALRSYSPIVKFTAVIGSLSFLVALIVFPALLLPERLAGLLFVDDTAALRLASLKSAWSLAEDHPILGVGYNAYQFAARDAGLIGDFTIHSRAGADNSLLTLAVTTGLVGVVLFLLPWAAIASYLVRASLVGSLTAAAAATSLAVLLVHSQFVNSFLYSHLLITLIIIVTLAMTNSQAPMSNE